MTKAANDNEQLSFITLSAATRNVVRWLESNKQNDEQSESNADPGRSDEQRPEGNRQNVDQGLKDIPTRGKIFGRN